MKPAKRLLLPAALAMLLPAAAQDANAAPNLDNASHADAPMTYGDWLTRFAHTAANRAAADRGADESMEAISDLAVRWLETRGGATRVWDQCPRGENSARAAVRNARRSLHRSERRHEKIATSVAAVDRGWRPAPQPAQVELGELLGALDSLDARDREVLALSAQGVDAREIGEQMGMSHAAARQRLSRARGKLRDLH